MYQIKLVPCAAPPKLRKKEAQAICRALGCSLRYTDGEYRVAYMAGTMHAGKVLNTEASAYYTEDLADACNTANAMHDWLQAHKEA